MTKPILRFAPSPNGYLHLGHAYSAFYTWARAKELGGSVLLRIEDIDTGRCWPEYIAQIYDDLTWLRLEWVGLDRDSTGKNLVRKQSEHFSDYRAAADKLTKMGLLYPCFCTRKDVIAAAGGAKDPDGAARYHGTCKLLSKSDVARHQQNGDAFALRLDMDKAVKKIQRAGRFEEQGTNEYTNNHGLIEHHDRQSVEQVDILAHCANYARLESWGDVVLVRKDTPTSYHLSVVVDDEKQNITHVTRGMDMFPSTAIHILLQGLLGFSTPIYEHHALIKDQTGQKLAKSLQHQSIKQMREDGVRLDEIKAKLQIER